MKPIPMAVLLAAVPILLLLFAVMPGRRALTLGMVLGSCFLPQYGIDVPGLPPFNKDTAATYSALFATLVLQPGALLGFRPKLLDVPMLLYCFSPLPSSLTNGLGAYDGFSESLSNLLVWGFPYLLGRIHFTELSHAKEMAYGFLIGALLYLPLVLIEARLSPQLHRWVYGYFQHKFSQTIRLGGFRPMVFMRHGLQVALFMNCALVVSLCMMVLGRAKQFVSMPMMVVVGALGVGVLVTKSLGAWFITAALLGLAMVALQMRMKLPLLLVSVACIGYVLARGSTVWDGEPLQTIVRALVAADRAQSMEFRMQNEDLLAYKAMQQPWFGWGGWGRNRVYDESGNDVTITDGLWIIVLGTSGIVGLASFYLALLGPPTAWLMKNGPRLWAREPDQWAGLALTLVCLFAAVYTIPNAHQLPILTCAIGVVASMVYAKRPVARAVSASPAVPSLSVGPMLPGAGLGGAGVGGIVPGTGAAVGWGRRALVARGRRSSALVTRRGV